jgi:hypothetical protein
MRWLKVCPTGRRIAIRAEEVDVVIDENGLQLSYDP